MIAHRAANFALAMLASTAVLVSAACTATPGSSPANSCNPRTEVCFSHAPGQVTPPPVQPTPATPAPTTAVQATAHPAWTQADVGACNQRLSSYSGGSFAGRIAWDGSSSQYNTPGNMGNVRQLLLGAVQRGLDGLAASPRPAVIPAKMEAAIVTELKHAEQQLSQPMIASAIDATIHDLDAVVNPAYDFCIEVQTWVTQNVPQ